MWKLYKDLTFEVSNHLFIPRCLCHSKDSVYLRVPFVKCEFYMVRVLGPRTTPKRSTTTCRLAATAYSVYSYQQVVYFICKPRTRHAPLLSVLSVHVISKSFLINYWIVTLTLKSTSKVYVPLFTKSVMHIPYTWLSQLSRHFSVLLLSYWLISSSVRRFSLFLASVLHDLVGKT